MHELEIMHRDIKSANVFLTQDMTAKLGDMNVSKIAKMGLNYTQTGTQRGARYSSLQLVAKARCPGSMTRDSSPTPLFLLKSAFLNILHESSAFILIGVLLYSYILIT